MLRRLHISQAAVDRLEMIERRGGAEVAALDEPNRQAALCRVVRDRQTVNTTAHHEHVEFVLGQPWKISNHGWISYSRPRCPPVRVKCHLSVPCAHTGTITYPTSISRRIRRDRRASSPISSSTTSRSCIICRGSCRSIGFADAACLKWDAEPARI